MFHRVAFRLLFGLVLFTTAVACEVPDIWK
jgi:hypothetical protein